MIKAKAQTLAERRVSNGWSKADLARAAGVHQTDVSRIELGKTTSPRTAKAIADALGAPVTELFDVILAAQEGA